MYRKIHETFTEWRNQQDRKPLILMGARQVGKTYSVREFALSRYQNVVEINFQDAASEREYFSTRRSASDILLFLQLNHPDIRFGEDTLLFFDEVQLCPELIASLKFLKEKCPCDVICSGSMLGIKINGISSFPVGYVETVIMDSMTFSEFLLANGMKEEFINTARKAVLQGEMVPEAIHEKFNELFTDYLICGGMPEAVKTYVSEGLAAAIKVCRRLMHDYEMDIAHYADSKTKIKALECFQSLPLQLAKENKKFQYKLIREGYNARYYEESLAWLKNAGLVYQVHRLKKIEQPLEIQKEMGIFKVYLFDTGLLVSSFSDRTISDIRQNVLGTYKGVVYENMAAQILNHFKYKCYYYEPNTSAEIDFVIEYDGGIVPVEVKSGLHTRSTSFDNFVRKHKSEKAFRFSKKNAGRSGDGIEWYLPVYSMEWVLE